jgi:tRNA 2-thiocytidine biosynthesis protein TtcA
VVKKMIHEWERQYPGRIDNMATAMGNITLSHLMDRKLFPFTTLKPSGQADPAGDKAFDDDEEACATPASTGTPAGPQVVQWAVRARD